MKRDMKWWWTRYNQKSIDGIQGIQTAHLSDKEPRTTRPHRFRSTADTSLEDLEKDAGADGLGFVKREARFLAGIAIGVFISLNFVLASKLLIR